MSGDGDDSNNTADGAAPKASPEQITAALRSAVQKQFKLDGNVIPSAMRTRVEQELSLAEGFFKSDPHWKAKCKTIIMSEFVALTDAAEEEGGEEAPPPKKKPAKKPAAKKSAAKPRAKKATPKIEPTNKDVAIHEQDEYDETPKIPAARRGKLTPKKPTPGRRAKPTVEEDDEADAAEATPATVPAPVPAPVPVPTTTTTTTTTAASDDDSELSELEDEPPKKPAKRARATTNASPKKPTPKRPKAKPTVKEESDAEEAAPPPPAAVAAVDSDNELSDADEPPTKKPGKRSLGASAKTASPKKKAKVALKASPKDEKKTEAAEEPKEQEDRSSTPAADDAGSDSEMSVVLDPTPKKGRSSGIGKVSAPKKTKSPRAPAGRKPKAKKADSKEGVPLDREQEQLKSLKAWLLKCGIRKVWSRELAKFDTPHAQIAHLRSILTEIGMTGRLSAEKAKKIKEERELRAEVEAVQLGAGEWGREEDTNAGKRKVSTRSMRTAPAAAEVVEKKEIRGMEEFAFLGDQSDSD